jgi:putative toxin-antitoxin system antitoxin component (TIGR02293 family)
MSQAIAVSVSSPHVFHIDLEAVEAGVPLTAIEEFSAYSGIPLKEFLEVVIPARTLKHRKVRKEPLNIDESDRFARVARLYDLSVRVFGNSEKARHWLSHPKHRFEERTPLSMLRTETGARQVEEALIQIDEGMFI